MSAGVLSCVPAGGVAGMHAMAQGTANTPPANSVMIQAPTSVPTAYGITLPGAPAAGFVQRTGTNPSVESVGPISGTNISGALICATTSNSGAAEVCNTSPTFTPVAGSTIIFQSDIANTGAFTLNVNSLGAKAVTKRGTNALVANDIAAAPFQVMLTYDGTQWEMQGQGAKAIMYTDTAVLASQLPNPSISTLGGVKSLDCTGTGHILKIGTDGAPTCSADSGGGATTISPKFWYPNGYPGYTTSNTVISFSAANSGIRMTMTTQTPTTMAYVYVHVPTGEAGKFASIALYSADMTTKLCETTPFSVATNGPKQGAWSCSSIPAGAYYVVVTSDSTVAKVSLYSYNSVASIEATFPGMTVNGFNSNGCLSTGTGAGIAFVSNASSCTWAQSTSGTLIFALGN